jgi:hypothetical protein
MNETKSHLPGFRRACTVVGVLYLALGGSMVLRGARQVMQPFGVPELVLSSPHFADFFHWVFVHMMVLGILIGMLGRFVVDGVSQRFVARILCLAELHYLYLDLRTSDSPLGNGLYRGSATLVPPIIDAAVVVVFAVLGMRSLRPAEPASTADRIAR